MTEEEARAWLESNFDVPRETWDRLECYVALLLEEAERQNLISQSTKAHIWARHIVDSAQLLRLARTVRGRWVDLGAGAGLPGIVVAILSDRPVTLIESRKLRVGFLDHVIEALRLPSALTSLTRVELVTLDQPAGIISARAFAPLPRLFATAVHLSDSETLWLLPKGRNWQNELASASEAWQAVFHVEQSITDADSAILTVRGLKKKGRR